MRLLKLFKFMAPVGLAALLVSLNPDTSSGQFPGGDRGSRGGDRGAPVGGAPGGDRGGRGGFSGFQPGSTSSPSPFAQGSPSGFGGGQFGGGGSQFGSGGGGRGGFSMRMDPDSTFLRLQQSYGGTGEMIDWSKVSGDARDSGNRMAQFSGLDPYPVSGTMSRDQYRDYSTKRTEAVRLKFSAGQLPGQATPTAAVTFGGTPTPGTPGAMQSQWGQQPGGFGGPSGRGQGGQPTDPSQITDEQAKDSMRRYDRDGDGKISAEEAQQSDRLRPGFAIYDQNKDGFIDTNEYKVYLSDRLSGRNPGDPSSQGSMSGQPGYPGDPRFPTPEEQRPTVFRFGKLPKELPPWFTSYDTDKDGQIGLYEWRAKDRTFAEFQPYDLNGDGLITAEEYLRAKGITLSPNPLNSPGSLSAKTDGVSARPNPWGGSGASLGNTPGGNPGGGFTRGGNGDTSGRDSGGKNSPGIFGRSDAPPGKDKESKLDRKEEKRDRNEGKQKGSNNK